VSFAFIKNKLKRLSWRGRRPEPKLSLGSRGEGAAARYLKRRHYRVMARNYACPVGEIDLVCQDGDTLVFVEVRTRADDEHQNPEEFAGPGKWRRVERAARYYLMEHDAAGRPCRFDLVSVVWPPRGTPRLEHFEDAFQARQP